MTWTSEPDLNDAEGREIVSDGVILIATVYSADDAALIAAAPDLLAALHGADEFCQQGLNSAEPAHWEAALHDIMGLVRETIAKAKA